MKRSKLLWLFLAGMLFWGGLGLQPATATAGPRSIRFAPGRADGSGFFKPITNKEMVLRIIPSRSYTETWIMWAWNKEGHAVYCILVVSKILFGTRIAIQFTLRSPDGRIRHKMIQYKRKNFKGRKDRLDVKLKKHRIWGDIDKWNLHIDFGAMGCDLKFERQLKGFRYQGGPLRFGSKMFIGLPYAPRAKVQGSLRYKGKKVAFRGKGYADRSWQNIMPQRISKRWYGARGLGKRYTVITTHLLTTPRWTPRHVSGVAIARDNKWIMATTDLKFTEGRYRKDTGSGYRVPMFVSYETRSLGVKQRFRLEIRHFEQYDRMDVFSQFNPILRFFLQKLISKPYVFRHQAQMKLTLLGKKGKNKVIYLPAQTEWAFINP